jgi:hypothetical protein
MTNNAILVPTRNRPHNIVALMNSLEKTNTKSTLIVIVDTDDSMLDEYNKLDVRLHLVEPGVRGMAHPLNSCASSLIANEDFDNFFFLGDDHRPRTNGWDLIWEQTLCELGTGLVYGDDLLQGINLPTAVGMTADIVRSLDGMVPKGFAHLYLDNFWLRLGQDLNAIRYLPETIIEHLHPIAGKVGWDQGYQEVNSSAVVSSDQQAFNDYIASDEYQELLEALTK